MTRRRKHPRKRLAGSPWLKLTPNAKRCLKQARVYMWHAWQNLRAAARWQMEGT